MAKERMRASREEVVIKKISTLDERIEACKTQIDKYEIEKQELKKELDTIKLQKLQKLMEEKGISVDELMELTANR